jgi:hypothetical protein
MNARNWLFGAIATVCWFLGSSVPAAAPALAPVPATATPVAAGEVLHNELIVLVLTKNPDGVDAPVNDASVTLFVGEDAKQRVTETDGKVTFPMPDSAEVTLRVVAANLKTQQEILSLHDAGAQPHKVVMEKQAADLADD